jgi:hypothetical protein
LYYVVYFKFIYLYILGLPYTQHKRRGHFPPINHEAQGMSEKKVIKNGTHKGSPPETASTMF